MARLKPLLEIETILHKNRLEYAELKANMHNYPRVQYPLNIDNIKACFTSPPIGIGRKAQLNLMTVDYAIGGFNQSELEFLQNNRGWIEFSLASIILWLRVIKQQCRDWLLESEILKLPVSMWKQTLGPWCNDVRRYNGVGFDDEETDALVAVQIRKLLNLSGRDLQEADFDKEMESIDPTNTVKVVPSSDRSMSCAKWYSELRFSIEKLIDIIEPQLAENVNFRTIKEWWETRRAWVPTGSSSERKRLKSFKEADHRIKAKDRPNKMQVIETISLTDMARVLIGEPKSFARASTKPEPGFKRRALYAGDDFSTYIASYASADFEKNITIGGMVAKQTPEDIVTWMQADLLRSNHPDRLWLSLDYADFNKEHSKIALAMLNTALCGMWLRLAKKHESEDIMCEKALCALWTARAHLNASCIYGDGTVRRHFSGLWSGHRDTARDNTMLHWCYSDIMQRMAEKYAKVNVEMLYVGMCGDDEDGLHKDWVSMATYLGMHQVCKLHLNPYKQLTDWYTHEFLQRQANRNMLPVRPIAPMIATLSTGSWYKQSYVYYDTVINSLTKNCTEIIARGAEPGIMIKVITNLINRMMTIEMVSISGDTIKIPLEWWDYRHGASGKDNIESLWYGTGDAKDAPDVTDHKFVIIDDTPRQAKDDWEEAKSKWLQGVGAVQKDRYARELLRESYKALYGQYRESRREELALKAFGIRRNMITNSSIEKLIQNGELITVTGKMESMFFNRLWRMLDQSNMQKRPMNNAILLDRLGLDPPLFELINGWEGFFRIADNKTIAKWEDVKQYVPEDIPEELQLADPALLSWWKTRHIYEP
jgi:hypothetical protein